MAELAQQLVNWLALGSIYSLLAVGFSLLFGVLNVIHFSHGDVSLLGPFIALALLQSLVAATGAGAEMRQAMGVAVFAGMIGVTVFGLFLTPIFYVVLVASLAGGALLARGACCLPAGADSRIRIAARSTTGR